MNLSFSVSVSGVTTCFSTERFCDVRKSMMYSPTDFSFPLMDGISTMFLWNVRRGDEVMILVRFVGVLFCVIWC